MKRTCLVVVLVFGLCAATLPAADSLRSRELAVKLTDALSERQMDAIAAKDPARDKGYTAALFFPGSQLLVVSADYPSPAYLDQVLQASDYKGAYSALYSSAIADTKLFIMDLGADGLHAGANQPIDVVFERVVDKTVLDGGSDKKAANYARRLMSLDERYSAVLQVLLNATMKAITRK